MKVEIRDITKEEAVPYGDNADIVLLHPPERHVSEWDADGNRPLR